MPARPSISTHVLDAENGQPARGLVARLYSLAAGAATLVGEQMTDADGRIADLLLGGLLTAGAYRLEFDIASYRLPRSYGEAPFFTTLTVDLAIANAGRHYHVPLLLSPFACTTYRGS